MWLLTLLPPPACLAGGTQKVAETIPSFPESRFLLLWKDLLKPFVLISFSSGGENIKSINQQSGAHVELQRNPPPNTDPGVRIFTIRGVPQQIELARHLIDEKVGVSCISHLGLSLSEVVSSLLGTCRPGLAGWHRMHTLTLFSFRTICSLTAMLNFGPQASIGLIFCCGPRGGSNCLLTLSIVGSCMRGKINCNKG